MIASVKGAVPEHTFYAVVAKDLRGTDLPDLKITQARNIASAK